jgi:RNA polymerase sigma-70 factor, ECF subfamily
MDEGASRPQGLDAFLASQQARALRVAELATRSRDEALDIVQDAMLQLARAYGQRPSDEWGPLFHRIVENKITDWQRRQSVRSRVFFWRREHPADDDEALPSAETLAADLSLPDAAERLMQQEALDKLEHLIRALPARQRQAFVMRVWHGFSTEEAAVAMGCAKGSVKTHLARALKTLQEQLGDSWSLEG